MTDLLTRLRQLARAEHDDLDIGDEAAEEIINLRVDVHVLRETLEKYKGDAARYRALRDVPEDEQMSRPVIAAWVPVGEGRRELMQLAGDDADRAMDDVIAGRFEMTEKS